MGLKLSNPGAYLAARDLEVSTRYYMDVLGFRKDLINTEGWNFLTRDSFRVMLGSAWMSDRLDVTTTVSVS